MSPEQAKGKPVDKRADIWAFGAVLFEMLTGRTAYQGDDVSEVLASVLAREPEWESLRIGSPRLRRLLGRCLEKDLNNRARDIGDVRLALSEIAEDPDAGADPEPVPTANRPLAAGLTAGGLLVGAVLTALLLPWLQGPEPSPVQRFRMALPADQAIADFGRPLLAFSPTGTHVAYVAGGQLFVRAIDELNALPLGPADDSPFSLAFSPDGEWIAYCSAAGTLRKRSVRGGNCHDTGHRIRRRDQLAGRLPAVRGTRRSGRQTNLGQRRRHRGHPRP